MVTISQIWKLTWMETTSSGLKNALISWGVTLKGNPVARTPRSVSISRTLTAIALHPAGIGGPVNKYLLKIKKVLYVQCSLNDWQCVENQPEPVRIILHWIVKQRSVRLIHFSFDNHTPHPFILQQIFHAEMSRFLTSDRRDSMQNEESLFITNSDTMDESVNSRLTHRWAWASSWTAAPSGCPLQ